MPELPEVDALVGYLREQAVGSFVAGVELSSISVLKTYDPPMDALLGSEITAVSRHGKFIDIDIDGLHLVIHLARAGWLRWSDKLGATRLKLGNGPIAMRLRLDNGTDSAPGFDLTEAGTRKGLAVYLVRDPADVPGIAALGPEPLVPGFTLRPLLDRKMQVKRLLRDQTIVAGIGNAYSDDILHAAKLSPFAIASTLDDDQIDRLDAALQDVLGGAVARAAGKPASQLKDAKRAHMRVHARTGEKCDVCGDVIAEVVFADSSLQYCPTCQTGGTILKDRSTSKFLK